MPYLLFTLNHLMQPPIRTPPSNLQPIATRGKKARGTLLVDIGTSFYNEISGGHIGSCRCSEEGLCRPSTTPVRLTA